MIRRLREFFSREEGPFPEFWEEYLGLFRQPKQQLSLAIDELNFVVLDTETTGLDVSKDQVLSIGAVRVRGNEIFVADSIELILQQDKQQGSESISIHGILPSASDAGIPAGEAIREFIDFIGNAVLVAHHAAFDIAMLNKLLRAEVKGKLNNYMLDTAKLALRLERSALSNSAYKSSEYGLDALCERYDIEVSDRHTASGDALLTAILFLKLVGGLEKRGVKQLKRLI